jgi:uncharacterized Zn-finger protein
MPIKKGSEKEACTERRYEITYADMPLSCPPSDSRVWDAHPRVYLPIEEVGEVVCPYCGALYVLKDFTPPEHALIRNSSDDDVI